MLRRLVQAGLLHSRKGHGGGFRLARPASEVHFDEILEVMDYGVEAHRCVFGWGKCNTTNPCPLHPAWADLKVAWQEWASTTTLEQAIRRGD